jgi:hypothetical protein
MAWYVLERLTNLKLAASRYIYGENIGKCNCWGSFSTNSPGTIYRRRYRSPRRPSGAFPESEGRRDKSQPTKYWEFVRSKE